MEDNVKKYLDKVLNSLIKETNIDFNMETINMPFFHPFHAYSFESYYFPFLFSLFSSSYSTVPPPFTEHCRDVYGLNDDEIDYLWIDYKTIINNKINNGR